MSSFVYYKKLNTMDKTFNGDIFYDWDGGNFDIEIKDKGGFTEDEIIALFFSVDPTDSFISELDSYISSKCEKYIGKEGKHYVQCDTNNLPLDFGAEYGASVLFATGKASLTCTVRTYYRSATYNDPADGYIDFIGKCSVLFTPDKCGKVNEFDEEIEKKPFTVLVKF